MDAISFGNILPQAIVDGIGGLADSSKDFARSAERLLSKTTVIHISQEETNKRTDEILWASWRCIWHAVT